MAIAWRRGFFRLWLVLSVIWFCMGIAFGIEHLNSQPYFWEDRYLWEPESGITTHSRTTGPALKLAGMASEGQLLVTHLEIASTNKKILVYYKPEFSEQWQEDVGAHIKKVFEDHKTSVWNDIWEGTQFFVGISLGVLLIGASISWALTGFRRRP